jgi:hypothetical protein
MKYFTSGSLYYGAFIALFLVFELANSQEILLSGYVLNTESNPVSDVNVSAMRANVSTTTIASGYFELKKSSGGSNSIINNYFESASVIYDGNKIILNCRNDQVTIEVFDLAGRFVKNILTHTNINGTFKIYPGAYLTDHSKSVYLVRVRMNSQVQSFKVVNFRETRYDKGLFEVSSGDFKSVQAIDTLILSHSLYETKKIALESYTGDLGSLTIEPITYDVPGKIEAEAYFSMSGIQLEACSEGGSNVGWIDEGDWMDYRVNVSSSGEYNVRFRVAADGSGEKSVQLIEGNNTSTANFNGTGGWQVWSDATATIFLNEGIQTIRVYASSTGFNLNYIELNRNIEYTFNGGSIFDLQAVSPELIFGTLNINGTLIIPSSLNQVTITCDNLNLNSSIDIEYETCFPYGHGPDLTLNVTGDANINGTIDLAGKNGKGETTTSTCNSCTGTDGGSLIVKANNITVNKGIWVSGGGGSYSYITSSIKCGCNGGDAGYIVLNAANNLSVSSASSLDIDGGSGGYGSLDCGNGSDGNKGILDWEGGTINIDEYNTGQEVNMLDYNAQIIEYEHLTIRGHVKYGEESDHRGMSGAWAVTYSGGIYDWLEDLYLMYLPETTSNVRFLLTASNSSADLDLFVLSENMQAILAQSNGSSSVEIIEGLNLDPGYYFIAVSYADDGLNLSTDYTLDLQYITW